LAGAIALATAYLALRAAGADAWMLRTARAFYLWATIAAILGFAHRHLNRPWRWLRWANESVYPWYMLHQTLIVAGAVLFSHWRLGPVVEPMMLVAFTVGGCWLLTDGLIRRVGWLRPLFGLPPRAPARDARTSAELAQSCKRLSRSQ
jgi:hypothetical protein